LKRALGAPLLALNGCAASAMNCWMRSSALRLPK
jgi:hypothetical protein